MATSQCLLTVVADIIIVDDAQVDLDKPLNVNGTVTAPAFTANTGIFTGNGSGLTALTGANVTGEVPFAAVANAVSRWKCIRSSSKRTCLRYSIYSGTAKRYFCWYTNKCFSKWCFQLSSQC